MTMEPEGAHSTNFYGGACTFTQSQPLFPASMVRSYANSTSPFPFNVNIIPNAGNNSAQQHPRAPCRAVVCDLPITRKASLHRFLEKRKDRIAARAPYQTRHSMTAPDKLAESMSWLSLAAKTPQI